MTSNTFQENWTDIQPIPTSRISRIHPGFQLLLLDPLPRAICLRTDSLGFSRILQHRLLGYRNGSSIIPSHPRTVDETDPAGDFSQILGTDPSTSPPSSISSHPDRWSTPPQRQGKLTRVIKETVQLPKNLKNPKNPWTRFQPLTRICFLVEFGV